MISKSKKGIQMSLKTIKKNILLVCLWSVQQAAAMETTSSEKGYKLESQIQARSSRTVEANDHLAMKKQDNVRHDLFGDPSYQWGIAIKQADNLHMQLQRLKNEPCDDLSTLWSEVLTNYEKDMRCSVLSLFYVYSNFQEYKQFFQYRGFDWVSFLEKAVDPKLTKHQTGYYRDILDLFLTLKSTPEWQQASQLLLSENNLWLTMVDLIAKIENKKDKRYIEWKSCIEEMLGVWSNIFDLIENLERIRLASPQDKQFKLSQQNVVWEILRRMDVEEGVSRRIVRWFTLDSQNAQTFKDMLYEKGAQNMNALDQLVHNQQQQSVEGADTVMKILENGQLTDDVKMLLFQSFDDGHFQEVDFLYALARENLSAKNIAIVKNLTRNNPFLQLNQVLIGEVLNFKDGGDLDFQDKVREVFDKNWLRQQGVVAAKIAAIQDVRKEVAKHNGKKMLLADMKINSFLQDFIEIDYKQCLEINEFVNEFRRRLMLDFQYPGIIDLLDALSGQGYDDDQLQMVVNLLEAGVFVATIEKVFLLDENFINRLKTENYALLLKKLNRFHDPVFFNDLYYKGCGFLENSKCLFEFLDILSTTLSAEEIREKIR